MFELQPHLSGDLLHLRPLQPADWEALFRAASDPLIWEVHPVSNPGKRRSSGNFSAKASSPMAPLQRLTAKPARSSAPRAIPISNRRRARSRLDPPFSRAPTGAAFTTVR